MEIVKNNSSILITCNTDDFTKVNDIWRADITGINRFIYQYYTCRIKVFNRSSSLDDRVSVTVPNKITKTVNAADDQKWYNLDGFDTNRLSLSEQTIFLDIYFDPNKTYGGSMVKVEFATDNSTIYCYNNNVEDTVVFKPISNLFHLTGIFRDNIDLINPTFEIEFPEVPTFNYVFINMFGRYYFVDSIECVRNGLYRIYCSIDVLMSYNEQLPDLQVYVTRQESNVNVDIPDNKLPVSAKQIFNITRLTELKSGVYFPYTSDGIGSYFADNFSAMTFTVSSAQPLYDRTNGETVDKRYYNYPPTPYNKASITLLPTLGNMKDVISKIMGTDTIGALKQIWSDTRSAFISAKLFPWQLSRYTHGYAQKSWYVGGSLTTFDSEIEGLIFKEGDTPYTEIKCGKYTFDRYFDDWRDFKPYSTISIYIPMIGWKELDANIIYADDYERTFYFRYLVDLVHGDGIFQIYVYVNELGYIDKKETPENIRIIYEYDFVAGVDIDVYSTNYVETIKKSISLGASVLSTALTGVNALPIAPEPTYTPKRHQPTKKYQRQLASYEQEKNKIETSTKINILGDVVTGLISNSAGGEKLSKGSNIFSFSDSEYFQLKVEFYNIIRPNNYEHIIGKPSSYSGRLGDLTGYTEVGAFHLEGINGITTEEKDLLENLLRSGIIM